MLSNQTRFDHKNAAASPITTVARANKQKFIKLNRTELRPKKKMSMPQ
jgi:hypothetical protein